MFIVMCRVSGGLTGTRQTVLKGEGGRELEFATREEAQERAGQLNTSMNHRYSIADFRYWVEER